MASASGTITVTILYPPAGATVPGSGWFYTWGETSGGDEGMMTCTAKVTQGGTTKNGTAVEPLQPGAKWAFMFQGAPTGSVTLTIDASDTVDTGTQSVNLSLPTL